MKSDRAGFMEKSSRVGFMAESCKAGFMDWLVNHLDYLM